MTETHEPGAQGAPLPPPGPPPPPAPGLRPAGPVNGAAAPTWGPSPPGAPQRGKGPLVVGLALLAVVVVVAAVLVLGQGDDDGGGTADDRAAGAGVGPGSGDAADPSGAGGAGAQEDLVEEAVRRYVEADSCPALAEATTQAYQANYVEVTGGQSGGDFVALCEQARQEGSTIAQAGEVGTVEVVSQDGETATAAATFAVAGQEVSLELPLRLEDGQWRIDSLGATEAGGDPEEALPSPEEGRAFAEEFLALVGSGDADTATEMVCSDAEGDIPGMIAEVAGRASLAIDPATAGPMATLYSVDLTGTVDGEPVNYAHVSAYHNPEPEGWCIYTFTVLP